ncbi:HipA N-terminal domain-containing protein [Vibrio sp. PP-XX7]
MVAQKYDTAKVSLFGKDVGALARNSVTGVVSFEYFEDWLKRGFAISHKLPLKSGVFSFPNLSYPTYKGLPAAFADTLPDDFGNAVINAWLARQGRDPQSFSALERLLYTGTRGMGALETFRRMAFNVIARNHDDHTKNWGFIINDQKKWILAPAFDLAYSYKPGSPWVDSHQMSINGKRDNFVKQDLMGVLPESLRDEAEEVMKKVHEAVLGWRRIATDIGVASSFIDEIESNHRRSLI